MRVSLWRGYELVLARCLLAACVALAPIGVAWLAAVGERDGVPIALVACGVPLLAVVPFLAPRLHRIDVAADAVVLHRVLAPRIVVPRAAVRGVVLVTQMATYGRYAQRTSEARAIVVGADGSALAHGAWLTQEPDVDALESAGIPAWFEHELLRPTALEARIPGSTRAVERGGLGGLVGVSLLVVAVIVAVVALVLQAVPA